MHRLTLDDVLELQKEYNCNGCGACCRNLPGFFLPSDKEELNRVAQFLNIGLRELINWYLVLDFRQPFGQKYWFWTPVVLSHDNKRLIPLYGKEEGFWEEKNDKIYCSIKRYPQIASRLTGEGGSCIFWDRGSGNCLIHPVKPLSCKLFNCQQNRLNLHNWLYFHFFGGITTSAPKEKKMLYDEWGICWDFLCPCCGKDEVEPTLPTIAAETANQKYGCNNCGYEFMVY